jgi:hypothetical protein
MRNIRDGFEMLGTQWSTNGTSARNIIANFQTCSMMPGRRGPAAGSDQTTSAVDHPTSTGTPGFDRAAGQTDVD